MIDTNQFKKIFPTNKSPQDWCDAINKYAFEYELTTKERLAAFLAQCGHESASFNVLSENLNYSASALQSVFKKYFPSDALANEFARQPERIANKVYANRMGNGAEASGDGWKYRGRGLIQLTGKSNYALFAHETKNPQALLTPDLVSQDKELALLSALWFWKKNNLNKIADLEDIEKLTRRINGGTHGLQDRAQRYQSAKKILT